MLMKWKVVEHKILDYKVVLTFWQSMAIIIFKGHLPFFQFSSRLLVFISRKKFMSLFLHLKMTLLIYSEFLNVIS